MKRCIAMLCLTLVLFGCQKNVLSDVNTLKHEEKIKDQRSISHKYYGENDHWEVILKTRIAKDEEVKNINDYREEETFYVEEVFIKAKEEIKEKILDGSLYDIEVKISDEDVFMQKRMDTSQFDDENKDEWMQKLEGEEPWIKSIYTEKDLNDLFTSKRDTFTAVICINDTENNDDKTDSEELILKFVK